MDNNDFIKKLWEPKIIEMLTKESMFKSEFVPKYNHNKITIWLCTKFKIGKYKTLMPTQINGVGKTIYINNIDTQDLKTK